MNLMHAWDQALMSVLPKFYRQHATPQTLYRIKRDIVALMRDQHHLHISRHEERQVRVEWLEESQSVNLVIPPQLLARTVH